MIFFENILVNIGIMIILATSLNLIVGITGILSLGHYAFFGIGAYSSILLTFYLHSMQIINYIPSFVLFFLVIIFGGIIAGFFSYIISYPVLKLKGDYLAVATLGFNEIFKSLMENIDFFGGAKGYSLYTKLGNTEPYFKTNLIWVYIFVVLTIFIIVRIMKSNYGRVLLAIRDDEIASESVGINIAKYKTLSFVIGSVMAGFAGVLFVMYDRFYATPKDFSFLEGISVLLMVVFGGLGSITGSVIGAITLTLILQLIKIIPFLSRHQILFYSFLLILMMILKPQGLFGRLDTTQNFINKIFKKIDRKEI
ncbi:MAG TPA: branched-chain amino acid ABC transporter permease [Spirochaetota bacterium]|nr:branched-chain amino acid ABC transporter permease [Spirochaetota bacterium]HOM39158.1 branched-chain amino acid ABC transporter permease [Spirochaetota bacterium]HPQ48335.1 branched-chain amino acid ABC transporter permease [Spirochaetota bacterium]